MCCLSVGELFFYCLEELSQCLFWHRHLGADGCVEQLLPVVKAEVMPLE